MKKKILLLAITVMAIMCIFAISVNAAEPSYAEGEYIYAADGATKLAIRDTDGNPLIWYLNGEELKWVRADQTDESKKVYVKYTYKTSGLSGFYGVTPTKALSDIDIYDNGTQIECAGKNSALVLINMEKLDIDAFNGWLFGNKAGCCLNMRGIVMPYTLKYIGQEAFTNTKLVQIWNLENTQLEYINWCDFAATSTLTQEATNYTIKMPSTLTFAISVSGSKIKTYIFSENTTAGDKNQTLRECHNLEKVYVPANFYESGFGAEVFRGINSKYLVFFTGTEEQASALQSNTNNYGYHNSNFMNATRISYETYLADPDTYDNSTTTLYVIYGINKCDVYYEGVHTYDNDCTTADACGHGCGLNTSANDTHNHVITFTYENGFSAEGKYCVNCANEGCDASDTETPKEAIFRANGGYSSNGRGGISGGWTVVAELFDLYNEINSDAPIKFGVMMINPDYLASERFFTDDYKVNAKDGGKGTFAVDMVHSDYTSFNFTVSGFESEALESLELVIAVYAYTEGGAVQFIQDAGSACKVSTLDYEDATLYTVSYAKTVEVARLTLNDIGDYAVPNKE